jgi:hypothetical protein
VLLSSILSVENLLQVSALFKFSALFEESSKKKNEFKEVAYRLKI